MRKKILLIMPKHAHLHEMVKENLEFLGHDVTYYSEKKFRYRNKFQQGENFFRKIILRDKCFKEHLRRTFYDECFSSFSENCKIKFDYGLFIRPDMYGVGIAEKASQICNKTIAYHWDGFSRYHIPAELIECFSVFAVFDETDFSAHKERHRNLVLACNFYFDFVKPPAEKHSDLFYIGSLEPSRLKILKHFQNLSDALSLKYMFRLFTQKKREEATVSMLQITSEELPYKEILNQSAGAKCIIDIRYPDHFGLSFRFYEALQFSQKIITNNETVAEKDFYNAENFLIFKNAEDVSAGQLKTFLESPYVEVPKEIREKYSFGKWWKEMTSLAENRTTSDAN